MVYKKFIKIKKKIYKKFKTITTLTILMATLSIGMCNAQCHSNQCSNACDRSLQSCIKTLFCKQEDFNININ